MSPPAPEPPPPASLALVDQVNLTFPADPRMVSLARMTASAITTLLAFSVEEIADLRLAIDELCTSCGEGSGKDSTVALAFTWNERGIRVECSVSPVSTTPRVALEEPDLLSQSDLSERILAALVDDYAIAPIEAATRRGHFVKYRDRDQP